MSFPTGATTHLSKVRKTTNNGYFNLLKTHSFFRLDFNELPHYSDKPTAEEAPISPWEKNKARVNNRWLAR